MRSAVPALCALSVVVACADDTASGATATSCSPGQTQPCPCANGTRGVALCTTSATPGPCVCEAPPATPPPQPTPSQLVGEDKPELVDVAGEAELSRQRWLDGRLRGHDNNMARMRSVTITGDPASGFTVRIANQFGFRCALEFGEDGRPSRLLRCRAGERGWSASPSQIDLDCETNERDEVCGGDYMLGGGSGYRSRARFQLVRRLGRDER